MPWCSRASAEKENPMTLTFLAIAAVCGAVWAAITEIVCRVNHWPADLPAAVVFVLVTVFLYELTNHLGRRGYGSRPGSE